MTESLDVLTKPRAFCAGKLSKFESRNFMNRYTTKSPARRRPLTGADFRALRHRIKDTRDGNYSAARLANDLGISESMLQFIETGHRKIKAHHVSAYQRIEHEYLYCVRDDAAQNANAAGWLVDAVTRYLPHLTPRDRNRLRRVLK